MNRYLNVTTFLVFCCVLAGCSDTTQPGEETAPNILMILVDDLGYSDIAPFGGEIPTPNVAQLAADGMMFTNFHTAVKCNPTRAMFLTGLDNNLGASGPRTDYQLRPDVPTLSEKLRDRGYHTYIAGKWDAGSDQDEWPIDRGFEQSFVLLPGAGLHYPAFDDADIRDDGSTSGYNENGSRIRLPDDFYSTTAYTDKMIQYIESNLDDDQPFFAFLTYTAPHYPLQAPPDYIERFDGWYDKGYQAIRTERLARLESLGLIDSADSAWSADNVPAWDTLTTEERGYEARRMQVYAAMVAALDDSIGELLAFLEDSGLRDNTLVLFASDNGADGTARGAGYRDAYDNNTENLGTASSYVTQGFNWAQISSTPWRLLKTYPTEGGTRAPLIARWPGYVPENRRSDEWLRISDLHHTLLAAADTNSATAALLGQSVYAADDVRIHTYIERRLGGASVLRDNWKLVWWKERGEYTTPELFNLADDPMETRDVAAANADVVDDLIQAWRDYAATIGEAIDEANPD